MGFWGRTAWVAYALFALSLVGIPVASAMDDLSKPRIVASEIVPVSHTPLHSDNLDYLLQIRARVSDGSVVLIRDRATGVVLPVKSTDYVLMRRARSWLIWQSSRSPSERQQMMDGLRTELSDLQQRSLELLDRAIRRIQEQRGGSP
jgi:hypothetical protein